MKEKLLAFLFSIIASVSFCQPAFTWAKSMGGTNDQEGHSIVVDKTGNLYLAGIFQNTIDSDPGPGTYNLVSAGVSDIFISKTDNSGTLLWAGRFGGCYSETNCSIGIDSSNNLYIGGMFQDTVDFDPGPGVFKMEAPPNGSTSIFICKLSSSGNLIWAKQIDAIGSMNMLTVDLGGNSYLTGEMDGTMDFDPGVGVYNMSPTNSQSGDAYVCKLSPTGNFVWAKQLGGDQSDFGSAITVDANETVYITGCFSDTADLDPGPSSSLLVAKAQFDIFVCHLDANGAFIWAKGMGGPEKDHSCDIKVNDQGNVFFTGYFEDSVDFDPGPNQYYLSTPGLWNFAAYICKLAPTGDLEWARQLGDSTGRAWGFSMAIDGNGNSLITGQFDQLVDFDPGPGTYPIASYGNMGDIFIWELDSSGELSCAARMGSLYQDVAYSMELDQVGNIYTTGSYRSTSDFDPGSNSYDLTSIGAEDVFISKLTPCMLPLGDPTAYAEPNYNVIISPNPSDGKFRLSLPLSCERMIIYSISGSLVSETNHLAAENEVDISELPNGTYILEILFGDDVLHKKIILNK